MNQNSAIPRHCDLSLNESSELAIHNAMLEVEKLGADTTLTDAVTKLYEAKLLVSKYIDEKLKTKTL